MILQDKLLKFNRVNIGIYSTDSFSDEKLLNNFSLKGLRLSSDEYYDYKHENTDLLYNARLEEVLKTLRDLRGFLSVDALSFNDHE